MSTRAAESAKNPANEVHPVVMEDEHTVNESRRQKRYLPSPEKTNPAPKEYEDCEKWMVRGYMALTRGLNRLLSWIEPSHRVMYRLNFSSWVGYAY